ncbi:hypothetical protein C2S51_003180 [Perilla frutescens var. frutescens]|nr:hypothetical protein C2S51_003180 [Perilla frutescens var. frutescens]
MIVFVQMVQWKLCTGKTHLLGLLVWNESPSSAQQRQEKEEPRHETSSCGFVVFCCHETSPCGFMVVTTGRLKLGGLGGKMYRGIYPPVLYYHSCLIKYKAKGLTSIT